MSDTGVCVGISERDMRVYRERTAIVRRLVHAFVIMCLLQRAVGQAKTEKCRLHACDD